MAETGCRRTWIVPGGGDEQMRDGSWVAMHDLIVHRGVGRIDGTNGILTAACARTFSAGCRMRPPTVRQAQGGQAWNDCLGDRYMVRQVCPEHFSASSGQAFHGSDGVDSGPFSSVRPSPLRQAQGRQAKGARSGGSISATRCGRHFQHCIRSAELRCRPSES